MLQLFSSLKVYRKNYPINIDYENTVVTFDIFQIHNNGSVGDWRCLKNWRCIDSDEKDSLQRRCISRHHVFTLWSATTRIPRGSKIKFCDRFAGRKQNIKLLLRATTNCPFEGIFDLVVVVSLQRLYLNGFNHLKLLHIGYNK